MTHRRWRPLVGLLTIAAGVAVVTGCAGSGSPPAESAGAPTSYFSPLDEYLSPQSGEAMPTSGEEWQEQDGKVQELIATCMAAEGFEYIPFVYPVSDGGMGMGMEDEFDQKAWTEKYGYGVSTYDDPVASDEEPVDPNQAIVEKMSASESEAYYRVLYGDEASMGMAVSSAASEPVPTTGTAEPGMEPSGVGTAAAESAATTDSTATDSTATDSTATDFTATDSTVADQADDLATSATAESAAAQTSSAGSSMAQPMVQGCYGEAQAEIYGEQFLGGGTDGSEFQEMWDGMSQLWESAQKDARLTQVTADWAGCLSNAGHPGFTEPMEPANDVNERWSELNGWPAMAERTEPMPEMTEEPTPPPADEVAKFRSEEIALAVADYDCRVKVGYDALFDSVRIEAEAQFVEEHRAELERYRDSMNSGGG